MISERLRTLIEHKNLTVYQFEKETGISKNSIATPIKNGKTVGSDSLGKISNRYPEVNLEWLVTGRGEMYRDLTNNSTQILPSTEKTKMITTDSLEKERLAGSIAFYGDIDVTAGPDMLFTDGSAQPSDYIHVPNFEDCDLAFPCGAIACGPCTRVARWYSVKSFMTGGITYHSVKYSWSLPTTCVQ